MFKKGLLWAVLAYILWGIFPIFWKQLSEIEASQILAHRIIWSVVFTFIILIVTRNWKWLLNITKQPITILSIFMASILLSGNWFTYIWAVNSERVVDASLGYFILPLMNVTLGVIFLHERLRLKQIFAITIAGIGVLYLTISFGSLPWIALVLGISFSLYSLIKKKTRLSSSQGLFSECLIMLIPSLIFLFSKEFSGEASFGHVNLRLHCLLIFSGVATALPLLLFAKAAKKIRLTSLGLLQYIAPTIQFLIGITVYNEPFPKSKLIGFSIIWVGLFLYSLDALSYQKNKIKNI